MSDDGRSKNTTARTPFDDADADVVLRTSDHVDFRVFRLILTLSSPFFQGMFSLPQPPDAHLARPNAPGASDPQTPRSSDQNAPSKPPTIDVPEDSQTLDALLRFLYPNTTPAPFRSLAHARGVALSASKYVMPAALDKIARAIEAQYGPTYPLHVYLLACRMGWEGVARGCARECLDARELVAADSGARSGSPSRQEAEDGLALFLDFQGAGAAYHRLETYRLAVQQAIEARLDDMALFEEEEEGDCEEDDDDESDGGERAGVSEYCLGRWVAKYLANIRSAVSKCPRRGTLEDSSLTPEGNCGRCDIHKARTIATARLEVASQIDAILSEVQLRFAP